MSGIEKLSAAISRHTVGYSDLTRQEDDEIESSSFEELYSG